MNTQILRFTLIKRLTALHPGRSAEEIAALALDLEQTNAYSADDAQRLVAVGTKHQLARARELAPSLHRQVASEMVAAASANSSPEAASLDRVNARLASMGLGSFDEAMAGDSDTRDFYGIDLSTLHTPKGAA
jgi:hypothetical protein